MVVDNGHSDGDDSPSSAGSQAASPSASAGGGLLGGIVNGITSAINPILSIPSGPSSSSKLTSPTLTPTLSTPSASLTSTAVSSSATSTTPSSTVASSTPVSTPTSSPTPAPISSASDVYVSGTGINAVTIHTTLAAQSQETAAAKPVSFLDNKPLSAGVFSLVGVVALVLLISLATLALRKRRHNRLESDAVDFAPSTHLTSPDDDEKSYPDLHRTRSNGSSNGSHAPPSAYGGGRVSPERAYAGGNAGYGGAPQLPGQSYGNGVYAYYDKPPPPSQQMYNAGPAPYANQAYNVPGGVPNPNAGYGLANPAMAQVSRLNTVASVRQAGQSPFEPERQQRSGLPYAGAYTDTSPTSSISYNAYNYNGYDDQPAAVDPRVQVGRKVSLTKATATATAAPLRKGSANTLQYDPTQPQMPPSPVLPPTFGDSASSDGHGGSLQIRNS
ncbi:hypothetical protein OF83DRAFT_1104075 [Amylostereum chailletii]|nr:hypothetical protein OF83DRAFT_1104075 [Amylostereum chailletii]